MRQVSKERTGWRDEALSERHREWGYDCPCLDIDFLSLEYDKGIPSALVEYKNEHAKDPSFSHPSYSALVKLGNASCIPAFCVKYADDFKWWKVLPMNEIATKALEDAGRKASTRKSCSLMSERQYVEFLYRIKGYECPDEILENLKD